MALADFDPTWVGSDIARSPAFEEPFAVARSLSKTADLMISGGSKALPDLETRKPISRNST